MRKWIFRLLLLGFALLLLANLAEIQALARALASGEPLWILAAAAMMIPYYIVYAVSFQAAYDAVGIKRSLRELLPVIFAMLFVNLVTPSGGSAGVALFVDDSSRRGHSGARAMSGVILQLLADFGSLSVLMIGGLVHLHRSGGLLPYHLAGAAIQIVITLILAVSLILGLWSPSLLLRLLRALERIANGSARLTRRPAFLADDWTEKFAAEMTEASRSIANRPSRLALAFLSMLAADLLAMAALYLLFPAFHTAAPPSAAAAGYVVGILFWMVPLTPQGVGIVEGLMTLTFVSFGIPAIPAAAVALSFRGLIFWLPMLLGSALLRKVKTFEDVETRPKRAPRPASAQERERAREIVHAHGRTSQAHLALLDDKTYHFTPGGSLIAYTVCGRTAVTLGDPIGPVEDAEPAIRGFLEFCRANRWLTAFAMVEADYLEIYHRLGYKSMCLGHEGAVELRSFTLQGNARKTLRKRFNRLTREGYRVEILDPPIRGDILRELRRISDEWMEMTGAEEKRFFLARFDEDYLRQERLALVYTPHGEISAFANVIPEYRRNGLSIDLMRHRRRFESGTMDFLFVSLIFWGQAHGYDTFNLGLSPLFGVGAGPRPSPIDRILRFVYTYGGFYSFKGLNGFKVKFRPRWTPLYMIFPGYASLLEVGLAVAKANAGEGETLWSYFKRHPKLVQSEEKAEETPLLAAGEKTPGEILAK